MLRSWQIIQHFSLSITAGKKHREGPEYSGEYDSKRTKTNPARGRLQTRLSELPPCSRVNTYILVRSRKKVFLPRGKPVETERKPVGILTGYETQKHFMTALNGARNSLLAITRCATAISIVSISVNEGMYFTAKYDVRAFWVQQFNPDDFPKYRTTCSGTVYSKLVRQSIPANYYFESDSVIKEGVQGFSLRKFVLEFVIR